MNKRLEILFLMGTTCSGKSTVTEELAKYKGVRVVQIGKELRAKYGENYFNGQASPAHVEDEAMEIYLQNVDMAIAEGAALLVVDGQPRNPSQASYLQSYLAGYKKHFVILHSDRSEREARALKSRNGASQELALSRLSNEYEDSYETVLKLLEFKIVPKVYWDNSNSHLSPSDFVDVLLWDLGFNPDLKD
jgi:adenylate kinase family enzyme